MHDGGNVEVPWLSNT